MSISPSQTATQSVLSCQNIGEMYRIREALQTLSAGAAILQAAEDSLYPACANLEQMRILVENMLNDGINEEIKATFANEFNELNRKYREISDTALFNNRQLHLDGQSFDLYAEGQTMIVWTAQSLPIIDSDPLADPKAVLQALRNAIESVAVYRYGILNLLTTLRKHSQSLLSKSEDMLQSSASLCSAAQANAAAHQTAACILQADSALPAHSQKIKTMASSLLF